MAEIADLYHLLVVKPLTYIEVHLFGKHVEDQVTADLNAFEPVVKSELTTLLGVKVATIVTTASITVTQVSEAVAPEVAALATEALVKANVPEKYKAQILAYATALVPDLVGVLYTDAVNKLSPA